MTEEFYVQEIPIRYARERQRLSEFLARHHLVYEDDVDVAFGIFQRND